MSRITSSGLARAAICAAGLLAAGLGHTQTVYRIVGADGRVTFSDKPPASAEQGKVTTAGVGGAAGASVASLPFELRQVVGRYPVTLYTSADCGPCGAGRAMLNARGVPFAERTVSTAEDVAALQRISGETSLPFLTVGGQRIKGFSDQEWSQYLDAAGYPATSMLPSGYRQVGASPLVAVEKAAPVKAEPKPEPQPVAAPSGPGPSNPAGIQF